jgi:hypothetical protein
MKTLMACPYLNVDVELTDERERHIAKRHPDLLPEHRARTADTLAEPDLVRQSARFANATLFSRWFDTIRGGKHVVVVVIGEGLPQGRNWMATAYLARNVEEGGVLWKRS